MFETTENGVVELNVRAKKYAKPVYGFTAYNNITAYKVKIHQKVPLSKEHYDSAIKVFTESGDFHSLEIIKNSYEPV